MPNEKPTALASKASAKPVNAFKDDGNGYPVQLVGQVTLYISDGPKPSAARPYEAEPALPSAPPPAGLLAVQPFPGQATPAPANPFFPSVTGAQPSAHHSFLRHSEAFPGGVVQGHLLRPGDTVLLDGESQHPHLYGVWTLQADGTFVPTPATYTLFRPAYLVTNGDYAGKQMVWAGHLPFPPSTAAMATDPAYAELAPVDDKAEADKAASDEDQKKKDREAKAESDLKGVLEGRIDAETGEPINPPPAPYKPGLFGQPVPAVNQPVPETNPDHPTYPERPSNSPLGRGPTFPLPG
jgi:hypothetical protein